MLAALGGCEPQLAGHAAANLNVGNDRTLLLNVLTQLLPYIGYPRTLNALRVLDQQHSVHDLRSDGQDEAFGEAVRPRTPGRDLDHLDTRVRHDCVERSRPYLDVFLTRWTTASRLWTPTLDGMFQVVKRLLVGQPLRSARLGETLLPKWIALAVFCSDPISSVAYATEQIVLVLAAGGLVALRTTPWVGLVVALLLVTVVASYRQTCFAYPSGGGAW
jgi:Carboxymuconolactone decarboxylase family